ncbi:hypothetical protein C8R43DRAFT_63503 [Mycena crocata]|nr:hypothetical protein C8R43DRAFT_63503 [Mycena crocata]
MSGMFCHLTNFFQNWTAFQRLRVRSNNAVSLPLMIRVSLFGFLPMVAMAISSMSFFPSSPIGEAKTNLTIACLPAAAAVIFGTQRVNMQYHNILIFY